MGTGATIPAFTPVPPSTQPTLPGVPEAAPKAKRVRKAKAKKTAAKKPRKAKATSKAKAASAPVQKRGRVAPLTMDVAAAFEVLSTVKKKEMGTVQQIVALLNPLPAKGRLRIMQSVATILR